MGLEMVWPARMRLNVLAIDGFVFEEGVLEGGDLGGVLDENPLGVLVGGADEAMDFGVDEFGGFVGVFALLGEEEAATWSWSVENLMGPRASLMPSSQTMARAMREACSMSAEAPEEMSPKKSSSAMRPPQQTRRLASIHFFWWTMRSFSGREKVAPP